MINIKIKDILNERLPPQLSKYSTDELIDSLREYYLEMDDVDNINKIENIKNKIDCENIIINLWNSHSICNISDECECVFCFNVITNSDNLTMKCGHISHSSCFFNYLFTNFNNNSTQKDKVTNLFRCPTCRKYLTEQIESHGENIVGEQNEQREENINENIDFNIFSNLYDYGIFNNTNNFPEQNFNLLFETNIQTLFYNLHDEYNASSSSEDESTDSR